MDTPQQTFCKILLVGEHCEDIYHYGTCNRLNPEAPVPILDQTHTTAVAGMSSNVKNNLLSFNFSVNHFKNTEHLEKHRLIDLTYKQHLIRFDIGDTPLKEFDVRLLKNDYDIIVISDYDKGFITTAVAKYICKKYKDRPIFVDSKKDDLTCYNNCFLKINEDEFNNLKNYNRDCELITTLGGSGAKYKSYYYPTDTVDVHDVCGAGDVFLASLVYGFNRLKSITKAIPIANKFASMSVNKLGAYVLTDTDINQIEKQNEKLFRN